MNLQIEKITFESISKFIDFPHDLFKNDPFYVPDLFMAVKDHLNPKRNPFFKHAMIEFFLAKRGDKVVGRIAAILNRNYNEYHNCNVSFFGFFDVEDNLETTQLLMREVERFARQHQSDRIIGPANFCTNDTAGLLIEGFNMPPMVQMTYNKPYYATHLEQLGFAKDMDLFAYKILTDQVNDKSIKLSQKIEDRLQKKGISIRNISKKNFKNEIPNVREIYRSAWEKNWGFVPPTDQEFDFLAEGLKLIIDEKYAFIAEENGKIIGFAVGLPNINEILIKIKRGRLFPLGIFKLLFGLKKCNSLRIVLLGVIESHRKLGIEGVFFSKFIKAAKENNIKYGEASWVLENNTLMNQASKNLNGLPYKKYRMYVKKI